MNRCEECFVPTSEQYCGVCQEKVALGLDSKYCDMGGCGAHIPLAEWVTTEGGWTARCECGLNAGVVGWSPYTKRG